VDSLDWRVFTAGRRVSPEDWRAVRLCIDMAATGAREFLDRVSECQLLDRLVATAREGQSAALVIRGEAGIGKTALLRYAAGQASGMRVAQIAGIEAEMELPFAGLHQLCAPMFARLDALPKPQRDALSVALGLSSGDPPDPFLGALAVLTLLSVDAEERPLLCLVDDAQWLDGATGQALAFVARRLVADSVAMVFAVREPANRPELAGLPELSLTGLDERSARSLLGKAIPGRLDDRVGERIVAETRGNPLALLELPRGMTAAELAGGFELPGTGDLSGRIEERYLQRVTALPEAAQRLMLLAAADPAGDATLFWRAADSLGIDRSALAPVEDGELLEIGARVRFRHPLVRSAVYRAASPADRQRVHEALAEVTDPASDADRRAWHRALATAGHDEDVAAELEHSAGRAQLRGGVAAAAAFLERAATLTADPASRARRLLGAAQATHQAGAPEAALALLAEAQAGPLDELQDAQAELLGALIAFTSSRGSDAPPLLLRAAKRFEPLDATLARDTYLYALMAAQLAGRFAAGAALEVAQAARAAPPSPTPRAPDLLLDGFAVLITEGHGAGAPILRRALNAFRSEDIADNGGFRWLFLAEMAAIELWDYDAWRELTVIEVQLVRDAGALTVLATALSVSIFVRIFAGELDAAAALLDEQKLVTEASGGQLAPHAALILTAWQGREDELSQLVAATIKEVVPRGEGIGLSATQWVTALLHNGLGQYETALAAVEELMEPPRRFDQAIGWALPEQIEAAARTGHVDLAHRALARLAEMTQAAGTDWGLGLEARCRALLSEHSVAESLYREAIERLGRSGLRGEHARAHLLYGEWLGRQDRRSDARDHLRTAHELFAAMGMEAFEERARGELAAVGELVETLPTQTRHELTTQEEQIARFARDGITNPEIGARLFLSPRTVQWHLRKVFTKLGIHSRRELANALRDSDLGTRPELV
jgi:DNA-binding CsgD family transcriptional regulator